MSDSLELATRRVFDAHHREQAADEEIYERLKSLVSAQYFGLEPADFDGIGVLDAGCGSNANASYAFLSMGARVHSVDLGDEWMDCARERLAPFGDRSTLGAEDVLELSLADGSFDFVHCAGVLHHTADPRHGFAELARVTRPGGRTFITVMAVGNGVLYQCVNVLRERYREDPDFRRTIDEVSAERIDSALDWLFGVRAAHEPAAPGEEELVRSLFDADLVLTIKDRLQAPTYHEFRFSEEELRGWYASEGYTDVRRLTRYTAGFRNLRRLLAPMYLEYDHPLSRFWFGDGYVQLIGTRGS